MRELGRGILVSEFIGGNSNSATGDFSTGVTGFLFEDGAIARPVSGLNLAGNHAEFWQRLAGIGDDPYPFSSVRIPSLVFEPMVVAGAS
jgi:PmbA protein